MCLGGGGTTCCKNFEACIAQPPASSLCAAVAASELPATRCPSAHGWPLPESGARWGAHGDTYPALEEHLTRTTASRALLAHLLRTVLIRGPSSLARVRLAPPALSPPAPQRCCAKTSSSSPWKTCSRREPGRVFQPAAGGGGGRLEGRGGSLASSPGLIGRLQSVLDSGSQVSSVYRLLAARPQNTAPALSGDGEGTSNNKTHATCPLHN